MAETVDQKLLKRTKFPPEFGQKVDMTKINVEVMKKWIAGKISEILGNEDDIVIELCFNLLEGERFPNIKVLQIQLTGFLDKDTARFCKELWTLCLSAQANPQGVPKELLEAKKLELIQEKLEAEKAADAARQQRDQDRMRGKDLEDIRRRERSERDNGRGRGGYRGRGGRDYDRRPFRRSPSPYGRRSDNADSRGPPPRRGDSYVPQGRGREARRRDRLSYSRSRSRSRSPSRSRSRSRPPMRRQRRRRSSSPPRSRSPISRRRRSQSYSRSPSPKRPRRRGNHEPARTTSPPQKTDTRSPSPRRSHRRRRSLSQSESRSRSRSPPGKRRRHKYSSSLSRSPPQGALRRSSPINSRGHFRSNIANSRHRSRDSSTDGYRQSRRRNQDLTRSRSSSRTPPVRVRKNTSSEPE